MGCCILKQQKVEIIPRNVVVIGLPNSGESTLIDQLKIQIENDYNINTNTNTNINHRINNYIIENIHKIIINTYLLNLINNLLQTKNELYDIINNLLNLKLN